MEKFEADLIDNFSTCKSPHEMVGVLSKTYYAQKTGVDPSQIFMTSIMPCTAKKYEIGRSGDMSSSGHQDVDVSITTRELIRMIKQSGIDVQNVEEIEEDSLLGHYSGAATIFGVTGGVMEAAVRTAYKMVTKKEMPKFEVEAARGLKGIKTGEVDVDGIKINIAVAHGLANVDALLKEVKEAKAQGKPSPYHFIEVMACEGGCVGGGGQPYGVSDALRKKRAQGLYGEDAAAKERASYESPAVNAVYKDFLGEPNGEKAHKFLHNRYKPQAEYKK
jgi:NADH-quinone oxidoreductase subunit G